MVEKIPPVRNPLTIIAIFAGLAEVAGTIVLPFISDSNQLLYVWFLILFPWFLVSVFFITLNFNPSVLYAPSDFRDEKNYMALFRPSSLDEKLRKLEEEVESVQAPVADTRPSQPASAAPMPVPQLSAGRSNSSRNKFILAEQAVIDKIALEFGVEPRRELSLDYRSGTFLFDAVFDLKDGFIVVEVKFLSDTLYLTGIREALAKMSLALLTLPSDVRKKSKIILAVVHENSDEHIKEVKKELVAMGAELFVGVEIRMYNWRDLVGGTVMTAA